VANCGGNKQLLAEEVAALLAEAWPAIAAYVGAELRDRHAVDDVMQEIGHAITAASERYDRDRPFLNWAFGVARIQILRHFERCAKERTVFSSELVDKLADACRAADYKPSRRREALEECLGRLPKRQSKAIRLYYHEELPQAEVAERMEMTATAVGVLIHRARVSLKDCIGRRLAAENEVGR
jgi:RNA polymerase sigma-70 factor, ECF subfamily